MKRAIVTSKAQSAQGLLSQAIESKGLIFTAGFIHVTPEGELVEGSIEKKLERIMANIQEVLISAGSDLDQVIKATIYVTDISTLPELNKKYVTYFSQPLPAREAVCVKALPLGADIEISVVAIKK